MKIKLVCLLLFVFNISLQAQTPTPQEIIKKSEENIRGTYAQAEMKMTIVRPDWSREVQMKSWSTGDDYSLILVTAPARDKGTAFLKRKKEMWNWQPKIDRVIKMPPSMMSQSWMGSDFTNDDLARANSRVEDFIQSIEGSDEVAGRDCWILQLIPKDEAGVVWGKIKIWIDKEDYIQMKSEFFDEDDYLVNTMVAKEIGTLGGRTLPRSMEMIPADEEGHKTVVEYLSLNFDKAIKDSFYSQQNMKRIR